MKQMLMIVCVAIMLAISFPVQHALGEERMFKDVTTNHSYYEEIDYLVQQQVINGFTDGTFKPNVNITKRQAAVMLSRALKQKNTNVKAPKAKDVTKKDSAYYEIATMIELGIFKNEANFHPSKNITREEMAYALAQAYSLEWTSPKQFKDVKKTDWAYPYINALSANGVTNGHTDGTFKPKDPVIRAHFSAFLYRTIHNKLDKTKELSLEQSITLGMTYEAVKSKLTMPLLIDEKNVLDKHEIVFNGAKFGHYTTVTLTFEQKVLTGILYNFRPANDVKEHGFNASYSSSHALLLDELLALHGENGKKTATDFAHIRQWDMGDYSIVWANHNEKTHTTATLKYFYKTSATNKVPTNEIAWVVPKPVEPITAITMDDALQLSKGEQQLLTVAVQSSEQTAKLQWTSSDEKVVRVDANGNVTITALRRIQ